MGRSALRSNERSVVWLADLIEATEAVTASDERCDPAIVRAFSHHLQTRRHSSLVYPPIRPAGVNRLEPYP